MAPFNRVVTMMRFLVGVVLGVFLSIHFFDQVSYIYHGIFGMILGLLKKIK